MNNTKNLYEKLLLERIKEGDQLAFSSIFSVYYKDLVLFAATFVKDLAASEEITQNAFVKFWEDREFISVHTSLKSYLLRMVQNQCIDWLRHLKIRDKYHLAILENSTAFDNETEHYVLHSELEQCIEKALTQLNPEIADAFRLNRYDGLKYHEIAERFNVSVRTIEVRIGKALHLLREQLKDYLPTIAICWGFFLA